MLWGGGDNEGEAGEGRRFTVPGAGSQVRGEDGRARAISRPSFTLVPLLSSTPHTPPPPFTHTLPPPPGLVTLAVATRFGCAATTGVDIDRALIGRACR